MLHCPFIHANNTKHKDREHLIGRPAIWDTKPNVYDVQSLPLRKSEKKYMYKLVKNRGALGDTLTDLDGCPILNCKHDWISGMYMCEGEGNFEQCSLKSQVKHSKLCKRSWSSDPPSDLRSSGDTSHTNRTVLFFFSGQMCASSWSGKAEVWNVAISAVYSHRVTLLILINYKHKNVSWHNAFHSLDQKRSWERGKKQKRRDIPAALHGNLT